MPQIIDLHTHSTASDGSLTPRELVRYAKQAGLSAIAVTDHDTAAGIEEAADEAERLGISFLPGVEVSVDFSPEMHILGYFKNGINNSFNSFLNQVRNERNMRNVSILRKLCRLGFDIHMNEVENEAKGSVAGRYHIARVMVKKGYVPDMDIALNNYLLQNGKAYCKKEGVKPEQAIGKILEEGGIPVLAHPIFLYMPAPELEDLVKKLAGFGLKGIETYYTYNSPEDTEYFLKIADKYHLLVTGGSDFHGEFKPHVKIGHGLGNLRVPYHLYTII